MPHRRQHPQAGLQTPGDILALLRNPMLRWEDVPGGDMLAMQLALHPEDSHLAELFQCLVQHQHAQALASGDPFHGNYPSPGVLLPLAPGRVPLCSLPTGEVLSLQLRERASNVLLCGPTGSGKTTQLRLMLLSLLALHEDCPTVVAFDRKGDLLDSETLCRAGLPLVPLRWHELPLAMLQPVPGMKTSTFAALIVQLLASHLSLFASRRLLLETLTLLYKRRRQPGHWPTLVEWVDVIEKIRVPAASRLGQYREATLFALKGVLNELGDVVHYSQSDFLEKLFATPGVFVIDTSGLSVEVASLLAGLFVNYAYESRGFPESDCTRPILFALDDALPLVTGSTASESEGGVNSLSNWAFMGRSRALGMIVSAQNYSLISPALRNNSSTLVCFGSYGRDAREVALDIHLTPEQAAVLHVLQPGEVVAICRSEWPQAVYGRVPHVP